MSDHTTTNGRLRQLALLGTALAASLAMLFSIASSASALSLGLMWTGDYNAAAPEMDQVGKAGASLFRYPVNPEHSSNGNNWEFYDAVFGSAAEHGVTILPQLSGRMNGAAGLPSSGEKTSWSEWVQKAVRRYGYNGVFWSTHPGIPARPAIAWEVWNEPNNPSFGVVSATEYGAFLAWAGPAIQSASESWGGAKTGVLFGGLLAWGSGTGYQTFLKNAYQTPGASSAFTGLAFHPYELDPSSFPGQTRMSAFEKSVNGARSYLNSLGGTGKTLWITETGWPAEAEYAVGDAEQANLLTASFNWAKANASSLNLQAIVWYNYRDINVPIWQYRCGLRRMDGSYRPAWYAFQEETGAPKWPVEGPKITNAPATFVSSNGTENVFVNTGGGINHYLRSPGGSWGGEIVATGSTFKGEPTAYTDSKGTEHVFVTTTGGINHYLRVPGGSWGGEVVATGSTFTSPPTAYTDSKGTEHVFVTTTGGINHYLRVPGGSWGGEVVATGSFTSAPSAYTDSKGTEHVFVTTGGGINHYLRAVGGSWGGEIVATASSFISAPSAYTDSKGTEHVFVTTSGGVNHYLRAVGGSWGGEIVATGSTFNSAPAAFTDSKSTEHTFVMTTGGVNHYLRVPGNSWGGEVVAAFPN